MAALLVVLVSAGPSAAQFLSKVDPGDTYVPTIWVDPDGCEHFAMDDGSNGYMAPHLRRDGTPVCREMNTCAVINTDTLFKSGSATLGGGGAAQVAAFFRKAGAFSYIIVGHTDTNGSDEANMALSSRRAEAVAKVARAAGAKLSDVRGYGERYPKASNATASGRAANRRVEVICIR